MVYPMFHSQSIEHSSFSFSIELQGSDSWATNGNHYMWWPLWRATIVSCLSEYQHYQWLLYSKFIRHCFARVLQPGAFWSLNTVVSSAAGPNQYINIICTLRKTTTTNNSQGMENMLQNISMTLRVPAHSNVHAHKIGHKFITS